MKIGTVALVTATVVGLSGCASLPPDNPAYRPYLVKNDRCSSQKCKVVVWVFLGKIYTNIEELGIDRLYTEVDIEWQLKWSSKYEFRADSIEFKPSSQHQDQFHDPVVSDDADQPVAKGGKKFRWTDRNTNDKPYPYTIKVYPEDSDTPIVRDPTIKNQG